jgi:hypothetical protein
MNSKDASAYPYSHIREDGNEYSYGLSKREYFAGMAMQGLLASGLFFEDWFEDRSLELGRGKSKLIAKWAIDVADRLLEKLEDESSIN